MAKATLDSAKRELSKTYARVYKRDGYRCVVCKRSVDPGSPDELKRAHPHHIVLRSQAPYAEDLHSESNLVTVCPICHADIHAKKVLVSGTATDLAIVRQP